MLLRVVHFDSHTSRGGVWLLSQVAFSVMELEATTLAIVRSQLGLQAFQYDQSSWESLQQLLQQLPGTPDVVVSNAGLGTATVNSVASEPHRQDELLLQVCHA